MPTYDYQCRSCGLVTEVIHAMKEDGPSVCEACGGALRRVLFPAGIIFKGPGFYRTDSRTSAAKPSSSEAGTKTSTPAKAADGGGESSSPASSASDGGSTD